LAQAVVGLQHRVAALVPDSDLNDQDGGFVKIRIHGDYHLGQTLKTDAGFIVIDFEGEPARPLDERRVKQCALKDVAGMLRSLDYAVETARAGAPEPAADLGSLRQAFLEGYLASALPAHAAFLPRNRSRVAAWLACFEAEKALYEVEYEINNRPTWVHMPLSGLLDILGGTAG
jgi:trehalose synthase-fused probable maltokinase